MTALPAFVIASLTLVGVCSLVAASASLGALGAAFVRKWAIVHRLARIAVFAGAGSVVASALTVGVVILTIHGDGAESRATQLARGISETMNGAALGALGLILGGVAWPLAVFLRRKGGDAA